MPSERGKAARHRASRKAASGDMSKETHQDSFSSYTVSLHCLFEMEPSVNKGHGALVSQDSEFLLPSLHPAAAPLRASVSHPAPLDLAEGLRAGQEGDLSLVTTKSPELRDRGQEDPSGQVREGPLAGKRRSLRLWKSTAKSCLPVHRQAPLLGAQPRVPSSRLRAAAQEALLIRGPCGGPKGHDTPTRMAAGLQGDPSRTPPLRWTKLPTQH